MQTYSPKNKLKASLPMNDDQSGMTLIEITLIVSILLGLVSIAFLGVTSFNKGSARAKCIMQQAKLQKITLSYANLNELNAGDAVTGFVNVIINDGYIKATPKCPDTGDYTFLDKIPNPTEHFVTCSIANHVSN